MPDPARVLVAGMGNVLRRDDGFGVAIARRLLDDGGLPPGVTAIDAGIAGVRIVQELMDGYDGVIFVDATERGGAPGTLYELLPSAAGPSSAGDAPDSLHMLEPSRVMALARAAGCLPPLVAVIGCQPADCDELALDLSPPVAAAVPRAVALVLARAQEWLLAPRGAGSRRPPGDAP